MTVRAKFELIEKNQKRHTTELVFETRYDDTIPEDARFETATPSGSIQMNCNNPRANDQFEVGKAYYVDFVACPDVSA